MDHRPHFTLAYFCALQAWARKLDGVVLDREPLVRYLGIERLKAERVIQLQNDFSGLFPYHDEWTASDDGEWERELHFARVPLTADLWRSERIATLKWPDDAPTEASLVTSALTLCAYTDPELRCTVSEIDLRPNRKLVPQCLEVYFSHTRHWDGIQAGPF